MENKILISAFTLLFLALALQSVSAGVYYTYDSYSGDGTLYVGMRPDAEQHYNYGPYGYGYYNARPLSYYRTCYSYDCDDLRWEKNPVCTWIENGDGWREEYRRARAAVWVSNSYDKRYNQVYGETSGEAFYYEDESATDNPSDWRNKPAYDPRVYGSNGDNYYAPRYNYESGTWNWRY